MGAILNGLSLSKLIATAQSARCVWAETRWRSRKGINPFTKEPAIFKAKPARKIIRARPVKAAKDAVS